MIGINKYSIETSRKDSENPEHVSGLE